MEKSESLDFEANVNLIKVFIDDLSKEISIMENASFIKEIAKKFELLASLEDSENNKALKSSLVNLGSFLFVSQLLIYYFLQKHNLNESLPEMEEILHLGEVKEKYFNKISEKYGEIFIIDPLAHLTDNSMLLAIINKLIIEIRVINEENITRDILGRFFHVLLPNKIRKDLSAFYTHPSPAQILAELAIENINDTVIDPACGSGTLLVAAYKRKKELFLSQYKNSKQKEKHKKFIEEDITGIDIMPFARELSNLNLKIQNIELNIKKLRVAVINSLELAEKLISDGQYTLDDSRFQINPVNVVLMNPPYTSKERMNDDLRIKLKSNPLGEICGHLVNLWGYFLVLGDLMLKENGTLGAVIPINFIRGKASEKIRNFFLKNYYIKYIIKPTNEFAFTENANFRDIILIAEKRAPTPKDRTTFIFIKKKSVDLTAKDCKKIVKKVLDLDHSVKKTFKCEYFEAFFVDNKELRSRNLSEFIWASNVDNILQTIEFLDLVREKGKAKLTKFKPKMLKEGFHTSPKGLSQIAFITDPMNGTRTARSFLLYEDQDDEFIYFKHKDGEKIYRIEINKVKKSFRTMTGVKNINISALKDYIITEAYKGFDEVLALTDFRDKENFSWKMINEKIKGKETYMTIFRRFSPYSKKTCVLSFFSDVKFTPSDSIKLLVTENKEEAIVLCGFLNSSISFLQFLINKQETTGMLADIKQNDLINFNIIDYERLTKDERSKIQMLMSNLKECIFPPIIEQFQDIKKKNLINYRKELDNLFLKLLGFSLQERNKWIKIIYAIIHKELLSMKNFNIKKKN